MLHLICSAIALLGLGAAENERYFWPLELERALTSSFAEYRPGRFHAGIDLRTGGIGQPVRAAYDGYVSRVRCSPYGYGKAIYLQLADGNTMVYGHLDDYYDELRTYVQSAQHKAQEYTVDLYPEPGQFKISKGQLIAKSGQTGIGAPHLHYELRNGRGDPINPLQTDTWWPDTTRPIIKRLLVAPHVEHGTVNGDLLPIVREVTHLGSGKYTASPIKASGRIGIGVEVSDPGVGGYNLGVYRIRLLADGREVFRIQHDDISYENHSDAAVSYHPYYSGQILNLWRWQGNKCSSYAHSPGDGWFEVPQGATELLVEVEDYFANAASLTLPIQESVEPEILMPGELRAGASPGQGSGKVSLDAKDNALIITASFSATENMAPEIMIEGAGTRYTPMWFVVDSKTFRCKFIPKQSGTYALSVLHPRMNAYSRSFGAFVRGQGGAYEQEGVKVEVPANAPYGLLLLRIMPSAESRKTSLRQVGPALTFWPDDAPIDASITVHFPRPAALTSTHGAQVYRMSGSGWSRESSSISGNTLRFTTGELGTYAVLVDETLPSIADVFPADGYQAKSKRPIIKATILDTGSGIAGWKVTANGKWLLTAYDPEHSLIEWDSDEDLPSGEQEMVFTITDAAQNTTTLKRRVLIP